MKKKITAIIMAVAMLCALSACSVTKEDATVKKSVKYKNDVMETIRLNEPYTYEGITVRFSNYRYELIQKGLTEKNSPNAYQVFYTISITNNTDEELIAAGGYSETAESMSVSRINFYSNDKFIGKPDVSFLQINETFVFASGESESLNSLQTSSLEPVQVTNGASLVTDVQIDVVNEDEPDTESKYCLEFAPKYWNGKSIVCELN